MKRFILLITLILAPLCFPSLALAADYYPSGKESGVLNSIICASNKQLLTITSDGDPCAADMCNPLKVSTLIWEVI